MQTLIRTILQQLSIHSLSLTFVLLWLAAVFISSRMEPGNWKEVITRAGFVSVGAVIGVWRYEKLRYYVDNDLKLLQQAVDSIKGDMDRVKLVQETIEPPNPALN